MQVPSVSSPVMLFLFSIALPLGLAAMGWYSRRNRFVVAGRTALITGGSQGMGRGLGKVLAQKGANVIIVARTESKLVEALEYIKSFASSASQRFHYIVADVTSPDENERLLEAATEWNNGVPPDIVWANAGTAYPHLFAETSVEVLRAQMDIDYWAAAYLARSCINLWVNKPDTKIPKPGGSQAKYPPFRHFIITSSVVAFTGLAGYGPYAPPKAALRCLADTLAQEFHLYNGAREHVPSPAAYPPMKNHIIFPAAIQSPGFEQENKFKHPVTYLLEEADGKPQTEDEVAAAAIAGLEKGYFQVTTNLLGYLMRSSAMGGSPRNGWMMLDTVTGWFTYILWLFVGPDMDSKVYSWGKKHGLEAIRTSPE